MKKIIYFILLIVFSTYGLESKNVIKVINMTSKPINLVIFNQNNYYTNGKWWTFKVDSIFHYKFDNAIGEYLYYIKRNPESPNEVIWNSYFSFLADTLIIEVKNDTLIQRSSESINNNILSSLYIDSTNYKMMQIKNKNNWEVFLKKANEIYESELSKISNIYINIPEIRDYEIEKLKMEYHTNLLDYIVDKTIYNDILNKNDIKNAYDSIIDYQVINYPKYKNSIEYKNMITNLFNYRNSLKIRNLLNLFRPRKSKEIMFEGLDSIGKQAMQVLIYKDIIDFVENPKYLKLIEKNVIKNDEINNDTKNVMLQIVQNKLSKSKGNSFPIQEFIGRESDTIRLKDYKGKVLLICFWASWCPGCVEDCEKVKLLTESINDANIEVLSISLDNDEKEYQEVVKNNCLINGKYLRIGFGFINSYYNILDLNSVPHLIVLDKEGKIYSSNYNTSSNKSAVRELKKLSKKGEK